MKILFFIFLIFSSIGALAWGSIAVFGVNFLDILFLETFSLPVVLHGAYIIIGFSGVFVLAVSIVKKR